MHSIGPELNSVFAWVDRPGVRTTYRKAATYSYKKFKLLILSVPRRDATSTTADVSSEKVSQFIELFSTQASLSSNDPSAQQIAAQRLFPLHKQTLTNVSSACRNDSLELIAALLQRKLWAITVADASFKLPSGVLQGDLNWLGSYSECINVTAQIKGNDQQAELFRAHYCSAMIGSQDPLASQAVTLGLCVPKACTEVDMQHVLKAALSKVSLGSMTVTMTCLPKSTRFGPSEVILIVFLACMGAALLAGTLYDVIIHQTKLEPATTPLNIDGVVDGAPPIGVDGVASETTPLMGGQGSKTVTDANKCQIQPWILVHGATFRCCKALLTLPKLISNVVSKIDVARYDREVRDYQVDQRLPNAACAIDEWWTAVEGEGKYPNLTKMALAVLTCFHGPLVEGSFNIMGDVVGGRNFRVELPTYSDLETVKYRLGMERSSEQTRDAAIKLLAVDNPVLAHPPKKPDAEHEAGVHHTQQNTREGMQNNKSSRLVKTALALSLYSNGAKVLDASTTREGTLGAIHGIRFISMTWVMLGHVYVFGISSFKNPVILLSYLQRFTFQAIWNATVSVDSFFVMSGTLVSYLLLREMKRSGGPRKINWLHFYLHRYWR
ncbi:hypothetical protein LSAT2_019618 [Lamellibrachia satsuma]|nr:hypothetical protein LSAT2_019618 [Lamellibrachia satsuma]